MQPRQNKSQLMTQVHFNQLAVFTDLAHLPESDDLAEVILGNFCCGLEKSEAALVTLPPQT